MKSVRSFSLFAVSIGFVLSGTLSACSSANRRVSSVDEYHDGSRAHPAAYLVDSFQVDRDMPEEKKGPQVPFYFKRCDQAGERDFYSRTSYDCDYPF